MTRIVYAMPELETRAPAHDPIAPRKRERIPSLQSVRKPDDAAIVAIILRHLQGERVETIAAREGLPLQTVRAWVQGQNRAHCLRAAESAYRRALGSKRKRGSGHIARGSQ